MSIRIRIGPRERVKRIARHLAGALAQPASAPVIVLGNQKAGTSAIAALLGKAAGLPTTIDLRNEISRPTFQHIPGGSLSFERFIAGNRLDFSRPIIKEPNLSLFYPQLARRFPAARFVFIFREPRDNTRSILDRLRVPGHLADICYADWPEISPAWRLVLDSSWAGLGGDGYVARLALRWKHLAALYLAQPDRFVLVRYEDFRADKLAAIHRLCEQLSLPIRKDISADLDRNFQRPGNRGTRLLDFFGPNYASFEALCAPEMEALGYL